MHQRLFIVSFFLLLVVAGESFAFDVSTQFTEGDDSSFSLAPEAPISSSVSSKVAIVDKSGLHYSDPLAAMNDIATWCGAPSETNLCLIRIMPGIYNLGTNTLIMEPYVDVEGSGENATKIKGGGRNGVIEFAGHGEIRFLTVEHTGGVFEQSIALGSGYAPSQKFTNITIISRNGTGTNCGIRYANTLDPPPTTPLVLRNVTIIASGGQKSIGIEHAYDGGIVNIYRSSIKGDTYSIWNYYLSRSFVNNTVLNGSIGSYGMTTCWHVYDKDYKFYANTCP